MDVNASQKNLSADKLLTHIHQTAKTTKYIEIIHDGEVKKIAYNEKNKSTSVCARASVCVYMCEMEWDGVREGTRKTEYSFIAQEQRSLLTWQCLIKIHTHTHTPRQYIQRKKNNNSGSSTRVCRLLLCDMMLPIELAGLISGWWYHLFSLKIRITIDRLGWNTEEILDSISEQMKHRAHAHNSLNWTEMEISKRN